MSAEDRPVHALGLQVYTLRALGALIDTRARIALSPEVRRCIADGAAFVARKCQEERYIYGVNTGFGSLCERRVEPDELELLQYNHVVSHACGVGEWVPERLSRLVVLIKLLTLRTGHTGIGVDTVEAMLELYNRDLVPAIPKRGTVGASGDLAPLAHLALPLLGLGHVHHDGRVVAAAEPLAAAGIRPIRLGPKEGLALTNGVQYINAIAVDCLLELRSLVGAADVVACLSLQAFSASRTFYQPLYQGTSLHVDRMTVAHNLCRLLEGSNHWTLPTANRSMQDPYSFRCLPQVHAAVRQVYHFALQTIEREINGVSDNPLFFPEQDQILFGGALHGESTAMAMDFLAIATCELASISERRTQQLLSGERGLPDFLVTKPGVNSGLMVAQYTSAALVNECKVLGSPASVDTIGTCQQQEDHVSMGGTSGYKLQQVLENCRTVLAIELLTAAQAVDLARGLELSPVTRDVHAAFRREVRFLDVDRVLADDINCATRFVATHAPQWVDRFELVGAA
ncbi:MAG: aromatic amino acid ammonia-lyase [Myxococcota bacterium]